MAIGTPWLLLNLALWTHELWFLRGVLKTFVPRGRIDRRENLVLIKNYLSSRIRFDVERRDRSSDRAWFGQGLLALLATSASLLWLGLG